MIVFLVKIIAALFILGCLVVAIYIMLQGDAELIFAKEKRTQAVVIGKTAERLDFAVELPYTNKGKEEGTILDAYLRIYLPQEQYGDVLLRGKVNLKDVPREDDYFEAVLVPANTGKTMVLKFEAYPKNGKSIQEAMAAIPDVDVALLADCRGRGALYTKKTILTLSAEEMRQLVK